MRFAIYGAGAVGQYLGAKLCKFGHDVSLISRGDRLSLIKKEGVTVYGADENLHVRPSATHNCSDVGVVDYVFLTVKAHQLSEIADKLNPLLGPETAVVSTQNGIPWWDFYKHGGVYDGMRIELLDPDGLITKAIPTDRIIGSIVFPAVSTIGPNKIRHIEGDKFPIGELDGQSTDRAKRLSNALIESGLRSPIKSNIRAEMWAKLLGNIAFNPISALTVATLDRLSAQKEIIEGARVVMEEADSVASALGIKIRVSLDQRLAGIEKVGAHKTSMLQDVELGRSMELESIIGAVIELGKMVDIGTPYTSFIYGLIKLRNDSLAESKMA